jgi:hypothetical protein
LCGKPFAIETVMGRIVPTIEIGGIEGDLCIHQKCLDVLEEVKGTGWERLPEGPLRKIYQKVAEEQHDQT